MDLPQKQGFLKRSLSHRGCHKGCHKLDQVVPQGYDEVPQATYSPSVEPLILSPKTRQSQPQKRNDKGQLAVKIGRREEYRVFKFPRSVADQEVDVRTARLKEVYRACGGWNALSNSIADSVKNGTIPVPLPSPYEMAGFLNYKYNGWVEWRKKLVETLPTIPWATLGESDANVHVLGAIRHIKVRQLEEAVDAIGQIDKTDYEVAMPVGGTLHEALVVYEKEVLLEEPHNFDRHTKIKQLLDRHADIPLATLGLDRCKKLIDYWRYRPQRHDGKGRYTVKRSREQLAELMRFFDWLHLGVQFAWREPEDLNRLDRSISKDSIERKSLSELKMVTFSLTDLRTLVLHAGMPEKLWIVWCLNCCHGAAEVGRVHWSDIYLDQDHPWRRKGLSLWEGGNWIGFLRPKTDVLGWWLLWPETVDLLLEWRKVCAGYLGRDIRADEDRYIIIRRSGEPLYGTAKNGQSGFANAFNRLKKLCNRMEAPVANLPLGTLRDQFSDWCGGDKAEATIASVALAHGIPNKDDKLLYKHYANKPWRRLFEMQLEFREYCSSVLDAIKLPPPIPPEIRRFIELWPTLEGNRTHRVGEAAKLLQISQSTVYRYLAEHFPKG